MRIKEGSGFQIGDSIVIIKEINQRCAKIAVKAKKSTNVKRF